MTVKIFSQQTRAPGEAMAATVDDPTLERHFKGHRGAVTSVAFSPSVRQVATGSADGTLLVWALHPAARALRLAGHAGAVTCVSRAAHPPVHPWPLLFHHQLTTERIIVLGVI
jgi:WD40 repeat protein